MDRFVVVTHHLGSVVVDVKEGKVCGTFVEKNAKQRTIDAQRHADHLNGYLTRRDTFLVNRS